MRGRNQGELFGSERVKVQVFQTKLNCTTKMKEKHIFVHQKAKLIEFLEHMVQVRSHFQIITESGFFQNLCRRYEILVSGKGFM